MKIFNIREKEYNCGIENLSRTWLAISILTHSFIIKNLISIFLKIMVKTYNIKATTLTIFKCIVQ